MGITELWATDSMHRGFVYVNCSSNARIETLIETRVDKYVCKLSHHLRREKKRNRGEGKCKGKNMKRRNSQYVLNQPLAARLAFLFFHYIFGNGPQFALKGKLLSVSLSHKLLLFAYSWTLFSLDPSGDTCSPPHVHRRTC